MAYRSFNLLFFLICVHFGSSVGVQNTSSIHFCCPENTLNITVNGHSFKCIDSEKKEQHFNISCRDAEIVLIDYDKQHLPGIDEEYCYIKEVETGNISQVAICEYIFEPYDTPASRYVLLPVSLLFLVVTLVIYYNIKTLREPDDVAFMNATTCLILFMICSELLMYIRQDYIAEIIVVLLMYSGGTFFCWFQVLMVIQLKHNMNSWPLTRTWIIGCKVYAWGMPLLLMGILFLTAFLRLRHVGYATGITVLLLLFISIILFFVMLYYAIKTDTRTNHAQLKKYRSWLYTKLYLVQLIPWKLEFIRLSIAESYHVHTHDEFNILIIFDCICALQGVFVFIVMVYQRHHVRRCLGGKRFLCIQIPENWADEVDTDDVYLVNDENKEEESQQII